MNFRALLKLLLAIYVTISLLAGYADIRLSDAFLYGGQMSRVHYYQTLQAHFVLGALLALAFSLLLRRSDPSDRDDIISTHVAVAIAFFLFLIFGVKVHLVWLNTHLLDREGLVWTGLLIAATVILLLLMRWLFRKLLRWKSIRIFSAALFLIVAITAISDFLLHPRVKAISGSPPNVVLIVTDTLRSDHVSSYGYARKTTPSIDALAREGALYETAISASPWTTPSHASMFSGQYPSRNGVDGRNIIMNPESHTLAETLRRNGYQTAGFINNVYIRRQTGLSRGFQQYEEFWGRNEGSSIMLLLELAQQKWTPRPDTGAAETRRSIERWLNHDWNGRNPFFLFVHFMEPHAPYGVPEKYLSEFLPPGITPEQARKVNQNPEPYICGKLQMTDQDFQVLNALYDNDIRYLDDQVGMLIASLKSRKLLDNTLLIFTADHGEHFGDHQLMSHELSVYDSLIHVPLIIRHPATIPAGTRIPEVVQTVDLFPSILGFLHIDPSGLDLQGASILPGKFDRKNAPFAFAEYQNDRAIDKIERLYPGVTNPACRRKALRVIRSADYKLIVGNDGTEELYAIKTDPGETNNIASTQKETVRILKQALEKWSTSFRASTFHKQEEISKEAQEELRALQYIQ